MYNKLFTKAAAIRIHKLKKVNKYIRYYLFDIYKQLLRKKSESNDALKQSSYKSKSCSCCCFLYLEMYGCTGKLVSGENQLISLCIDIE